MTTNPFFPNRTPEEDEAIHREERKKISIAFLFNVYNSLVKDKQSTNAIWATHEAIHYLTKECPLCVNCFKCGILFDEKDGIPGMDGEGLLCVNCPREEYI